MFLLRILLKKNHNSMPTVSIIMNAIRAFTESNVIIKKSLKKTIARLNIKHITVYIAVLIALKGIHSFA